MTQVNPSGYYSMQCLCGFWHTSNLKPQAEWSEDDCKAQEQHQQFHLHQQAYSAAAPKR